MNDAKKKAKEKAEEAGMTWDEAEQEPQLPAEDFGYPHAVSHWSSCVEIVDPHTEKAVLEKYELDNNEAAVSIATVVFDSVGPAPYLAVGTGRHIGAEKTGHIGAEKAEAYIRIYRILEGGKKLEYLHKTKVPAIPLALLAFKGRLAVGVGPDLALYDIGMKQLLRKSLLEKATPTRIMQLHTQGSRIVCADQRESLTYVVHKEEGNRLISFVDDTVARYTTCSAMNDYETSVGGDKFGNIWMLRCPADVSASSDEEGAGMHLLQDKSYLGGTPSRLDLMMHYFTQDIPMAIQKTSLTPGGDPVVFWAGLQGTLGVFIPFNRRRDVKMFQQLELAMRQEDKPICGRDHLAYRGYYAPVKGAIDGDLCERFLLLSNDSKQSVAVGLDGTWTPSAIEERIWTMRGLLAF
jgi:splicing factor 3B subunit 3